MQGIIERLALHTAYELDELIHIRKLAVHRHIADVRHGVDTLQLLDHFHADDARGYLPLVVPVELCHNFIRCHIQLIHAYRAFLAGLDHTAQDFLAVECLVYVVAFYHAQLRALDLLVRCVAVLTTYALTTSAYARAVLRHARVDHFVFHVTALDASHAPHLSTICGGVK